MENSQTTRASLRVLVLDDDPFILDVLRDMLDTLGYSEVQTENDARRALRNLGQAPPDALICDLSMPDMDGIEFMQAAAAAGFQGGVLLLSGMDAGVRKAAERLARANGLNVVGAFSKPFSMADLHAALQPLLQLKAPPAPRAM